MTLGYHNDSGRDYFFGRATLHVEIDIFFFSVSVDLVVERRFGGNSSGRLTGRRRYLLDEDPFAAHDKRHHPDARVVG